LFALPWRTYVHEGINHLLSGMILRVVCSKRVLHWYRIFTTIGGTEDILSEDILKIHWVDIPVHPHAGQ
jgi:hypothetical protein